MRLHAQYSNNYIATSLLLLKTNKGWIRRIRSASVSTLQSHKFRLKAAYIIISEALQQMTNCVYILECLCVWEGKVVCLREFFSKMQAAFSCLNWEWHTGRSGGVLRVMQIRSAKVIQSAQSPLCIMRSDSYNGCLLEDWKNRRALWCDPGGCDSHTLFESAFEVPLQKIYIYLVFGQCLICQPYAHACLKCKQLTVI